jgi:hypothetical protein
VAETNPISERRYLSFHSIRGEHKHRTCPEIKSTRTLFMRSGTAPSPCETRKRISRARLPSRVVAALVNDGETSFDGKSRHTNFTQSHLALRVFVCL